MLLSVYIFCEVIGNDYKLNVVIFSCVDDVLKIVKSHQIVKRLHSCTRPRTFPPERRVEINRTDNYLHIFKLWHLLPLLSHPHCAVLLDFLFLQLDWLNLSFILFLWLEGVLSSEGFLWLVNALIAAIDPQDGLRSGLVDVQKLGGLADGVAFFFDLLNESFSHLNGKTSTS